MQYDRRRNCSTRQWILLGRTVKPSKPSVTFQARARVADEGFVGAVEIEISAKQIHRLDPVRGSLEQAAIAEARRNSPCRSRHGASSCRSPYIRR